MNAAQALSDHGRSVIVDALKAEIIGPDPAGEPLKLDVNPHFPNLESSFGPWVDAATGEEILNDPRIGPMRRYASGVLFPENQTESEVVFDDAPIVDPEEQDVIEVEQSKRRLVKVADNDANDYALSSANELDPRSAAISFVVPEIGTTLKVRVSGAYYEQFTVTVDGGKKGSSQRAWYVRRPIEFRAELALNDGGGNENGFQKLAVVASRDNHPLSIDIYCFMRRLSGRPENFATLAVKNNSSGKSCNTHGLFQTEFSVECLDSAKNPVKFPPYPEREDSVLLANDPEARSLSLLYREFPTYAVGHGCSADWSPSEGVAFAVRGHYFPSHQVPSVTPDIKDENGNQLELSMATLAGLDGASDPFSSLDVLADAYERWISRRQAEIAGLTTRVQPTADDHLKACRSVLARMRGGIALIRSDDNARLAFQYANESVYKQQLDTPPDTRKITINKAGLKQVEPRPPKSTNKGKWRPFQIGFLLASLASTANADDRDRDAVELIFFPTGGGKTEAYQALIAFSLFLQRLRGTDQRVGALMRYTLRLLTTQQFTRAASLICYMELIRQAHEVPEPSFSIGIWVGGSVTPLKRDGALKEYRRLLKDKDDDHHFLLTKCPYCSTDFGKVEGVKSGPAAWPAFRESTSPFTGGKKTLVFTCPDSTCPFHDEKSPLPVWIIDEDIYERRPSLIIATVDKFAQVAFRGDISCLFGLDGDGNRIYAPPSLIVQDELHLISGPLGTMVGLYEWLFEELCIDRRPEKLPAKPKIVCSTATIRNYKTQIRSLYARTEANLFPPHGLTIEDSFFARYARDELGRLEQGRLYVGVLGTSLRSTQDLQVRVTSALLQAPKSLDQELQDPWFTLLSFFNRISDIGTTFNLLQINVGAHLRSIWSRQGHNHESGRRRYVNGRSVLELTSRVKDAELPKTIDRLFKTAGDNAVDTCLASNIIEVGIDIPRLSLLSILGQPKTTSQYIQVTGRVGRMWQTKPGLVVTMYPPRRPRDRSHFEKFRAFHQRLYASVEPTSVTPFSTPAMERAIHAVIVGYVRNFGARNLGPQPIPSKLIDYVVNELRLRVAIVDPRQVADYDLIAKKRIHQWSVRARTEWEGSYDEDSLPLLYRAGKYLPDNKAALAWSTPPTMRNVDAECIVKIDDIYLRRAEGHND